MDKHFWKTPEDIRGLIALPDIWHLRLGDNFAAFNILCLQPSPDLALAFPCPGKTAAASIGSSSATTAPARSPSADATRQAARTSP